MTFVLTLIALITLLGLFQAQLTEDQRNAAEQKRKERELRERQQTMFLNQLFLLSFKESLLTSDLGSGKTPRSAIRPGEYIRILEDTETNQVINKMTIDPAVSQFLNGSSFEYAQLVPSIELFKVIYRGETEVDEVQFPFYNFFASIPGDPNTGGDVYSEQIGGGSGGNVGAVITQAFRGSDAGIESINFTIEGRDRNAFSAQIIKATVKLYFQDVKVFFRKFGGISYSDMVRVPPGANPANYNRIRMVLGWNANDSLFADINKGDFASVVNNTKTSLILDFWKHDMEFLENGSLRVSISYNGAVENAFGSADADIINTSVLTAGHTEERSVMEASIASLTTILDNPEKIQEAILNNTELAGIGRLGMSGNSGVFKSANAMVHARERGAAPTGIVGALNPYISGLTGHAFAQNMGQYKEVRTREELDEQIKEYEALIDGSQTRLAASSADMAVNQQFLNHLKETRDALVTVGVDGARTEIERRRQRIIDSLEQRQSNEENFMIFSYIFLIL